MCLATTPTAVNEMKVSTTTAITAIADTTLLPVRRGFDWLVPGSLTVTDSNANLRSALAPGLANAFGRLRLFLGAGGGCCVVSGVLGVSVLVALRSWGKPSPWKAFAHSGP